MAKTFTEIPVARPGTPLLDEVDTPADLRTLARDQLRGLADELRAWLLYSVGRSGGHFGAGLGVVELTVALHYLFDTPHDRLVWDVGHQSYPHKILTGRREQMQTIRQQDGLSGFPSRDESCYDTFGVGHSSTSISAALGMALGARLSGNKRRVVAIIGDGAMTAGEAFEALNHAAHTRANLLVILNDNTMSIGHNIGGLASYFARIWASGHCMSLDEDGRKRLIARPASWDFAHRDGADSGEDVNPDLLFEALGINYVGPLDGHDLDGLMRTLATLRDQPGPQLLHLYTTKGKGYGPAEADPVRYHAIDKIEPTTTVAVARPVRPSGPKYQQVFGDWLCDLAARDRRVVGITPAMREGSGMVEYSERFPDRFHDVAICEQHAVTLAGGLACEGQKPVVAIYSTFLQRGYDQLIHDIALQDLDVTFALDRAGLVGGDGATHNGVFDLASLRTVPNLIIAAPSDENECRQLLYTAWLHEGPSAVRYPRGRGPGTPIEETLTALPIGISRTLRRGQSGTAILAFGALVQPALAAGARLDATVVNMRWVKPLDRAAIIELACRHGLLVTVEDHQRMAGAGSAVNELLMEEDARVSVLNLGLPDHFIGHGQREGLLADQGLDATGIERSIRQRLEASRAARPDQA